MLTRGERQIALQRVREFMETAAKTSPIECAPRRPTLSSVAGS
jgi:hypothetical protein